MNIMEEGHLGDNHPSRSPDWRKRLLQPITLLILTKLNVTTPKNTKTPNNHTYA